MVKRAAESSFTRICEHLRAYIYAKYYEDNIYSLSDKSELVSVLIVPSCFLSEGGATIDWKSVIQRKKRLNT